MQCLQVSVSRPPTVYEWLIKNLICPNLPGHGIALQGRWTGTKQKNILVWTLKWKWEFLMCIWIYFALLCLSTRERSWRAMMILEMYAVCLITNWPTSPVNCQQWWWTVASGWAAWAACFRTSWLFIWNTLETSAAIWTASEDDY